ncbi:hypothetical protein BDV27DRAFT_165021 [Aspergillus caelatus]|uniref:Rhodopsin domain-containing protein n=2 Tax=Aspergillus subgen. Circumdati TaxID=2720871 RepID=A0A5N7ANK7_9EURO|nr:uncharacterized protein BDV27DRAFT_165021 [Aspergillus caelatus]KAE8370866.1 hypothetical protein BDV27DRAFT_165021 [Aspergillus caelatus]KAE8423994.1 hypothetical protein BDV36DRAFT_278971 [Aspergillus pseudocaelatus]
MSSGITFDIVTRAAEEEAAQAAFRKSAIESWTLYAIGVAATILRTYARGSAVGFRHLRADDYLIWVGILFYTAQTALAYSVGNVAHGLANNGMTDAQRAALSVDDPEFRFRVDYILSVDLVAQALHVGILRSTYGWSWPALSSPSLYWLCPRHRDFYSEHYICQAAISKPIVWVSFAANVSTDLYLITIPIPVLWSTKLKLAKKIASTVVLSAGVFVLVCATLKSVFVLVDPLHGAELSGAWGTRETFVAVITTNLPMIFHLFKSWLGRVYGSAFNSNPTHKYPSGFQSIGGGGGDSRSRNRRKPSSGHPTVGTLTLTESEERMVGDVKMQNLKTYPASPTGTVASSILVSSRIEVTHEDRSSRNSELDPQRLHETW